MPPDPTLPRWQCWIDRGGTFTDCVLRDPRDGTLQAVKVLSSDAAPLEGLRALLELTPQDRLPACDLRMGTTLATNALLERRGRPTLLVVNEGLGDVLRIGDQTRPALFALDIVQPVPLPEAVLELRFRRTAQGARLGVFDEAEIEAQLRHHVERGLESVAIALVHAYRDGEDERRVAELARRAGAKHVTLSHALSGARGLLGRADTAVADAYLTPVIRAYVAALHDELGDSRLRLMQSDGGLVDAGRFRGKDAVLSGPAGGAVAVRAVAEELGLAQVVGFDMGGTSTDVCRFAGDFARRDENQVAGVRIRAPMIEIHTVAAGGGSICALDGKRLVVGPESAGADPGPLCYGRATATALSLTDVALCLGRVDGARFPFALDADRPRKALQTIAKALREKGIERSHLELAEGFLDVAVENMAAAIREVSVARGYDVRDHALVVFGGAAGQYAARVARRLGVRKLAVHPLAGVLSAFGMGVARPRWQAEANADGEPLNEASVVRWRRVGAQLAERGRAVLAREEPGVDSEAWAQVALRYRGTETTIPIAIASAAQMASAFEAAHRRAFGYSRPGHLIEGATVAVAVEVIRAPLQLPVVTGDTRDPVEHRALWLHGGWQQTPVYEWDRLLPGHTIEGPAIVENQMGAVIVERGFVAQRNQTGYLLLDAIEAVRPIVASEPLDPVRLEVYNNLFTSIAEQMGHVLRRTALSTNIRDRRDYSCAVFDADGELVANAPHIPVHLGAMSATVQVVRAAHPNPQPGDVFVSNDPAAGGTHLPDITVVTPLQLEDKETAFWVASRGHHADVGGISPGSMPSHATRIDEEGVVFRNEMAVKAGVLQEDALRALLCAGPHPARNPEENLADLRAQIAANQMGAELLRELAQRDGSHVIQRYMRHMQDNAAELVAEAIAALPDGEQTFCDSLDDGTEIRVRLEVRDGRLRIDFSGTGPSADNNLNAPLAVTRAAVLYVLRVLVGRPIPLNAGCFRPVDLQIPAGTILSPEPWRAVSAGNVETSQRVVDVLFGALGLAAASQGTMNNVAFGTETFGYYETLGGGAGATSTSPGASAVHTHMTNSRITDVEVIEGRFPVRVRRFEVRKGSGGCGAHAGGDGLIRELEFLEPVELSVISERRRIGPYGLQGGGPGASGCNLLNGRPIPARATLRVKAGDVFRIETPGGGGWGSDVSR